MTIREQRRYAPSSINSLRHRTKPEQLVGLGIFALIGLGFNLASGLNTQFLSIPYTLFLILGMWVLWRKHSLRVLKLELALFLSQFLLQLGWRIEEALLVLVSLLLLATATLITALLFWKKERNAGFLYFFPILWVSCLACLNMFHCIKGS